MASLSLGSQRGLLPLTLAGCSEGYSPNTYAATAAQQQATVQRGVIIGVRPVLISADGTIGAAAGGAVGGVAGAEAAGGPVTTALGAVGGALVGGIGGTVAEQAVADAKGWEYVVQESDGSLVSVTQTSKMAFPVGLHVLVIDGKQQARVVPDYTVQIAAAPPTAKVPKSAAASNGSTTTPIHVSPLTPAAGAAGPVQVAPVTVAGGPTVPSAPRPASADPAGTPPATSSMSGAAATPEPASNRSSATGTPSAGSPARSVQVAPGVSIPIPPVSSPSTAIP